MFSIFRFSRVEWAIEIGVGYTTPYLLRALKDNIAGHTWGQNQLQVHLTKKSGISISILHLCITARVRNPEKSN